MFRLFIFGLLASILSGCLASSGPPPETAYSSPDSPSMLVLIQGEIRPGELKAIKKDIETKLDSPPQSYSQRLFVLASHGGDADEAMLIGRYIREIKGTTLVPETGKCYSACVFVLAGGLQRDIQGPVAVNWPDFEFGGGASAHTGLSPALSVTTDFFTEMNVPSSLAEEMYRIPPSELRQLSDSELLFYFSR